MLAQGEVWWANLPVPIGSEAGYRRPVIIVQGDAFNRSRISTVVCVPLTGNLRLARAPGNIILPAASTGLDHDSVANVSLVTTIDRSLRSELVGSISRRELIAVLSGIDIVLGR
jgi:mRNA interferase MazF